eukprot:maker-scaffold_54-snap-gene-0.41-mRNA-1 protein AED:0.78 eAED:0.81 QI:0/0/0/0.33/0/0/3/0/76
MVAFLSVMEANLTLQKTTKIDNRTGSVANNVESITPVESEEEEAKNTTPEQNVPKKKKKKKERKKRMTKEDALEMV